MGARPAMLELARTVPVFDAPQTGAILDGPRPESGSMYNDADMLGPDRETLFKKKV